MSTAVVYTEHQCFSHRGTMNGCWQRSKQLVTAVDNPVGFDVTLPHSTYLTVTAPSTTLPHRGLCLEMHDEILTFKIS